MDDHAHEDDPNARITSPMQAFTTKQAMTGAVVVLVGLVIAFGLPLLLL